ncbi:MAG: hypothetical protein AAFX44_18450 [Pseudomonadota bacterium]
MQITAKNGVWIASAMLALIGVSLSAAPAYAENARETGRATIDMRGKKPKVAETREAILLAEINAVESYVSRSPLKLDLFDKCLRDSVGENIRDYVLDSSVLREEPRASSRQLTVTVKAEINESRLDLALERCKGATERRNRIAFVFIARQQAEAGGFTVPAVNSGVESSVEQVFLENKFLVTSSSKMETDFADYQRQRLVRQYAATGSVDWVSAEKAAAFMSNDFAALGTFDIQQATTDAATGLIRVAVIGQGQLIDLQYDAKLAVTGRISEFALGASVEEAATNAFTLAAERMAKRMVDQINAQGYQ